MNEIIKIILILFYKIIIKYSLHKIAFFKTKKNVSLI
jgi:hypothetical protein